MPGLRSRSLRTRQATAAYCGVVLCLLALLPGPTPARADDDGIAAVEAIGITVGDVDRAVAFYQQVLNFVPVSEAEIAGETYERLFGVFGMRARVVRMQLGAEFIELIEFLAPPGRPIPTDSRSNDRWFQHVAIIVSDMAAAYARLRAHGVSHASSGPQRLPDWNPQAGGIEAFYFRDPDGNPLEILAFPPGKGARRWHAATDALFLGIDHSAIVVADTQASLAFYRDALGLAVAGASENYGPEQERLNNVFGARLRITALRARAGPGIELLEYLAPADGRAMPADTAANDLWHWQIRVSAGSPGALATRARAYGGSWVSPGEVTLGDRLLGVGAAHMIRDPDGHAVVFARH